MFAKSSSLLLATALLIGSTPAHRFLPEAKNLQALLVRSALLTSPLVVDNWNDVNSLAIVFRGFGTPQPPELANDRPCVHLSMFTKAEWAGVFAQNLKPAEIRPEMASVQMTYYPAIGDRKALVRTDAGQTMDVFPGMQQFLPRMGIPVTVQPGSQAKCEANRLTI